MPFGQSFWVGRIVSGIAEAVTNDPEIAKGIGKTAKWITAAVTHDWHTAIIDEVAENFVEEGAETFIEETADSLIDEYGEDINISYTEPSPLTIDEGHQSSFHGMSSQIRFSGPSMDDAPAVPTLKTLDPEKLKSFLSDISPQVSSDTTLDGIIKSALKSNDPNQILTATQELKKNVNFAHLLPPWLGFSGYGPR